MQFVRNHWRVLTSGLISVGILILAFVNRAWLVEAFLVVADANRAWLLFALVVILISYLISAQVLALTLHSMGYRLGFFRTWATGLVAIIISQSVPAGGVGSYAFLIGIFRRRGVPPVEAALAASMESLSYVSAMLIVFAMSLIYLTLHGLATGSASYIAALIALTVIGSAAYVLTRSQAELERWLHTLNSGLGDTLQRRLGANWIERGVRRLVTSRQMLTSRRRDLVQLVIVQLLGLSGHALAMLLVLRSLGTHTSFAIVLTAFGIALITSTFNVLPGGGGTVEAAIVAVLLQLGVGSAAVAAAIIFRLFNFWLLTPVAAGCYYWLMHEPPEEEPIVLEQSLPLRPPSDVMMPATPNPPSASETEQPH